MIIGLTDNVAPRFPRLGKLRKGDERPENGKAPGKDTDHFRFDSPDAATADAFAAAYGPDPALLHVFLPYPTPEENFATWKEAWVAGGLSHRCDGVTCTIWRTKDGRYSREPKPCPGGCKEVGRLELVLPELIKAGWVGYVTMETHSNHDLRNIQAALNQAYAGKRKDLRGIEFTLCRVKQEISTPTADGGRARREKWLVYLYPSVKWAQLQLALSQAQALQLPAPAAETYDAETGEIIDARVRPVVIPAQAKADPAVVGPDFDAPAAPAAGSPDPARVAQAIADAKEAMRKTAETLAPGKVTPPAAPANGNGVSPMRRARDSFTRLWGYKGPLGVEFAALPGDATLEQIQAQGKALKAALFARAMTLLPEIEGGWAQDWSTLDAAVAQLKSSEPQEA